MGGGQCRCSGSFLDPQLEQKPAATPKPRGGTTRAFTPWSAACNWQTLALLRNPRGSQLRSPGRLTHSLPLQYPDAVRPWTCAWPPPSQRQPAIQAAFDRKLTHFRNELGELRQQNVLYRPLGTADGRPHTAVTRTLQYADIASSRNGQQMLAKSLQRRWKHEIQIALLRRRAAMARAVLPNPSARAEWVPNGISGRALHHWGHVPPLDGGPGDHDHADSETDTAMPEDDDDIASLTSCSFESLQPSSL